VFQGILFELLLYFWKQNMICEHSGALIQGILIADLFEATKSENKC
jgi:hypothetical protein